MKKTPNQMTQGNVLWEEADQRPGGPPHVTDDRPLLHRIDGRDGFEKSPAVT
jgi:hypothetical protein